MGRLLEGSAIAVGGAAPGGTFAFSSDTTRSRFTGRDDALSRDDNVRTAMFGADWSQGDLITGVSVPRSMGEGRYKQGHWEKNAVIEQIRIRGSRNIAKARGKLGSTNLVGGASAAGKTTVVEAIAAVSLAATLAAHGPTAGPAPITARVPSTMDYVVVRSEAGLASNTIERLPASRVGGEPQRDWLLGLEAERMVFAGTADEWSEIAVAIAEGPLGAQARPASEGNEALAVIEMESGERGRRVVALATPEAAKLLAEDARRGLAPELAAMEQTVPNGVAAWMAVNRATILANMPAGLDEDIGATAAMIEGAAIWMDALPPDSVTIALLCENEATAAALATTAGLLMPDGSGISIRSEGRMLYAQIAGPRRRR